MFAYRNTPGAGRGRAHRLAAGLAGAALVAAVLPGAAQAQAASATHAAVSAATAQSPVAPSPGPADWPFAGGTVTDDHDATAETAVGNGNVADLQQKWTFTTGGSVSATPTVVDGDVYFPDWAGNLYKVQATTGAQVWSHPIGFYTGISNDVSRVSPAYWNGEIVTGDGSQTNTDTDGAFLFAVNAQTGGEIWKTQIDSDPAAIVTSSPVIDNGVIYVGVSSKAEILPSASTFRGSMVALDAKTGRILWKTYVVPTGYTGGAIWGSNAVVDESTGLVYVGTGNNYTVPAGVCTSPDQTGCSTDAPNNYQDAIVAFNMTTGAIVWGTKTLTADTWTIAKMFGPDFDFGTGPNLFTTTINGVTTQLIGIGQKSGVYWALNPVTGAIVWDTAVGPGGNLGGLEWGTAADGQRIYVANTNTNHLSVTLTSATGQTSTTTGGFWAALDPATGKILWETAAPGPSSPLAFLTTADGVLYSGTTDTTGDDMFALDTATGAIEWSFAAGGTVLGGPAIVDGSVYWGSGYHTQQLGPFFPGNGDNDKFYAFDLPLSHAAPQTVYVAPGANSSAADTSCSSPAFSSINTAIGAVASGGQVVVCSGTFNEDVNISKPLQLEGLSNATVNAANQINGIDITASNVEVTGLTVENAVGEGILVDGVSNATIEDNIVTGNDTGTGSSPVANAYLACQSDCGQGIHLLGSSGDKVESNTVSNDSGGILISDETGPSANNMIVGNSLQNDATAGGIALVSRNGAAAPGGTPAPAAGGVFGNTIESNSALNDGLGSGGGGITLASAVAGGAVYGNTVLQNTVSGNGYAGVTVHGQVSGVDLSGNAVSDNIVATNNVLGDPDTGTATDGHTTGILVTTVDPVSIQITGNTISGDVFGIWTDGPVTAANAAGANSFSNVTTHVSAN